MRVALGAWVMGAPDFEEGATRAMQLTFPKAPFCDRRHLHEGPFLLFQESLKFLARLTNVSEVGDCAGGSG